MIRKFTLHLFESYFRHRWLNLLPILVMIIASIFYIFTLKDDYDSQGVLYVNSQSLLAALTSQKDSSNFWITPAQTTVSEINELLKTDSFIRAIIKQTKLESEMTNEPAVVNGVFSEVRKRITVNALGNNQALIVASNQDPITSYQLVNSLVDNYVQWKMNSKETESQAALAFFSDLIASYKADLEKSRKALTTYIGEHPEPIRGDRPFLEQIEIDRLTGQIKMDEDRYTNALDKEENAKLSLQQIESDTRQTYMVIDAPDIPVKTNTSLKKTAIRLGVFWLVGVFLSAILIVGSYLLDRTVRFSLDVTSQLNLPVLAVIPDTNHHEPDLLAYKKSIFKLLPARNNSRISRSSEISIQDIDNPSQTQL